MRTVWGIGETVYDIIFKNNQPVSANAGGSVLNAMVSLARLGHQVQFISEIGKDFVGDNIVRFLKDNHIGTDNILQYNDGKSTLALAFLNQKNDAVYDFYKHYPKDRLANLTPPFKKDDIVLFGSSYAVDPDIHEALNHIIHQAKEKGCILVYDPNYRKKQDVIDQYMPFINENISNANILKGSDEDFKNIYKSKTAEETFHFTKDLCPNLTYTANAHGVYCLNQNTNKHYPVSPIEPVSTIGAGDNFNAGIIHSLLQQNITLEKIPNLKEEHWQKIVQSGIDLSSKVCMSLLNYIE